jgi:hypothetical protein
MKKLVIFLALFVFAATAFGQKGKPIAFTGDTVQGNETIYITVVEDMATDASFSISVLCEQLGGVTDGTITLEGNAGAGWEPLTDITDVVKGVGNDSLTMADNAVHVWLVQKNYFSDYRLKVAGTASDTTLISGYKFFMK